MKKYFVYFLGVVIMTFGVALSSFHGIGVSPFDTLTFNVSKITNIDLGTIMIIFNGAFLLVYFLVNRNKDIYISIIVVILFSVFVNTFVYLISTFIINLIPPMVVGGWIGKIVLFILSFIFTCIGIAMVELSNLSKTAYECFNSVIYKKIFNKLSYGTSRMIVDISVTVISAILGLAFINSTGDAGLGTIFYMIFTGPFVQLLMKIMKFCK